MLSRVLLSVKPLFLLTMLLPSYIDIHTHQEDTGPDTFALKNRYDRFELIADGQYYSLGLHPWYLHDLATQMDLLERYAADSKVLAIGECGLDKVCPTPWPLQEKAFRLQSALAERLNKPLIIHCVRAYTEVMALLKGVRVPVILHGFQKKPELAAALLQQGYYLSFGKALLENKAQAASSLAAMPPDRFFLETDDMDLPVEKIYGAAVRIRKTGADALILQLQKNFKTVFAL